MWERRSNTAEQGIKTLSVPERSTLTNMGAELGITTSLFPSDEVTRQFFAAQDREADWRELLPDPDAVYDEVIDIDLETIEPNVALPHSPDNVRTVREAGPIEAHQVLIGSCTNSSYRDLMVVAAMLKGKRVHPDVSFGVVAGSRQVLRMITENGALNDIIDSGARYSGIGVRFLCRLRPIPPIRRELDPHQQSEFRGEKRDQGRKGVPGKPGGGRGDRPDRQTDRSPGSRHGISRRTAFPPDSISMTG